MLKVWIVLKRLKNIARAIIYYWTYRDMADKMGKYWRSSLLIIVKGVMKGYRTPYLIGAVIASLQAKKLQYKKVYFNLLALICLSKHTLYTF